MLMTAEGECFSCLPGGERSVQVRHVNPALADQIWNWCRLITKIPFLGAIILACRLRDLHNPVKSRAWIATS
jgi:hypothetical protein